MFEVRVEADFAAAHFLKDYNGKCENLHGHNYKVFAHVKGTELNEGGMLLDFSLLNKVLKSVCKELDHTNLNDMEIFMNNPSAERIAMYIFNQIIVKMKENNIQIPLVAIGGIGKEDIPSILECGVGGIALSGGVLKAKDPIKEMNDIKTIIY